MKTFYIATTLSRAKEHNIVRDLLTNEGYRLTYDWTEHGSVQHEELKRREEVARNEIAGVLAADFVIVMLPGGFGTHTEMGIAIAAEKPIILHSEDPVPFQPGANTVAFYYSPGVTRICCPLSEPTALLEATASLFAVKL